jgi:CMP-N-acetylneuraminic acid synthetase
MILGLIPARGGSKGVPRKNVRSCAGKPLIAWTIEAARQSKLLDEFVVSTEDPEIAAVARSWGAVICERPRELATDEASTEDVMQQVLSLFPKAEVLVLLQPTSPIRDSDLIDRCVDQFLQTKVDSLATGFVCKFIEYGRPAARRQEIPGFFYDDGSVYVMRADLMRKGDRYGKNLARIETDREQNVEIDDEFDFWLAERVLHRRQGLPEAELVKSKDA